MNPTKDENLRLKALLLDIYEMVTDSARGEPNFVGQEVAETIEISGLLGFDARAR